MCKKVFARLVYKPTPGIAQLVFTMYTKKQIIQTNVSVNYLIEPFKLNISMLSILVKIGALLSWVHFGSLLATEGIGKVRRVHDGLVAATGGGGGGGGNRSGQATEAETSGDDELQ